MSTITLSQTVAVFAVGTTARFLGNYLASQANTLFQGAYAGFRLAYIQVGANVLSRVPGWFGQNLSPTHRALTHVVCAAIHTRVTKKMFNQSPVEALATGLVSTAIVLHPYIREKLCGREQLALERREI
ncbi:MAG: hypothetical protein ABSA17_07345 [Rhabdochlamydiaceae bacterium]|jgi:hypothetical protein